MKTIAILFVAFCAAVISASAQTNSPISTRTINLTAAQGIKDAAKNRDIVARQMTPAQIAEAQKLAREWKPTKQPR